MSQILRSRVAPFAAVYGIVLGSAINWSDDVPRVRPLVTVLLYGALSVVPAVFGYLIVREAPRPSLMYGVFAPVYVVLLAVIALAVTTTGASGASMVFFAIVGMPWPALLAIIGGLYAGERVGAGKDEGETR